MKPKFYNIRQEVKDYYGIGNNASFLFMNFHRYNRKSQWTCSIESAGVFTNKEAKAIVAELRKEYYTNCEYYIVECPNDVRHNLRCCFV